MPVSGLKAALRFLFASALVAIMVSTAYALPAPPSVPAPAVLLWTDPIQTQDVAVSRDGQYVAVVALVDSTSQVRFYGRSSQTPLWTWSSTEKLFSVAVSADGNCVVAGGSSHVFFWEDANSRSASNNAWTWVSTSLGPIQTRNLDISDDGNYVVAGGTGGAVKLRF